MRTIVDIPDERLRELDAYAAAKRVSRAEAVRRAIGSFLASDGDEAAQRKAALEATFGSWADWERDAREFVDELREEWDERARRLGL